MSNIDYAQMSALEGIMWTMSSILQIMEMGLEAEGENGSLLPLLSSLKVRFVYPNGNISLTHICAKGNGAKM